MKSRTIQILVKSILIILLSNISTDSQAQNNDLYKWVNFLKSKQQFEQDSETYKYYKKARRQKIAATTFGVISIGTIAAGTVSAIGFNSTGQSADIAGIVVIGGLYFIGAITGSTALIYNFGAKRNKVKTISLYGEKYGFGLILNNKQSSNYVFRTNLNSNGLGFVLSF